MKRFTVIRKFCKFLNEMDIVIFTGKEMCKEAYQYDKPGYFYIKEPNGVATTFAVGLAMNTQKRVFVFVGEGDLLREMGSLAQVAAARLYNIYIVVINNGIYEEAGGYPNVFNSMLSPKGMFFNTGFQVFNFTQHFKKNWKDIENVIERLRGTSVAIFMDVEKGGKKDLPEVGLSENENANRLRQFLEDERTALFEPPPIFPVEIPEDRLTKLDLDKAPTGGEEWLTKT